MERAGRRRPEGRGVFGGSGEALQDDARAVIARTRADVLYLDLPYLGTSSYAPTYAALDGLLGDDDLASASIPTLDDLLTAAHDVPLIVLSYGGPTVTLDDLVATVERHRPVRRALAVPYAHLRSIARKEKSHANRELIVIAGR